MDLPPRVREYVERTFGADLGDEEDARAFSGAIPDLVRVIAIHRDHQSATKLPSFPLPEASGRPPRPSTLASGLELAWFVVERTVPFLRLLDGSCAGGFRRGRRPRDQIGQWALLTAAWNHTHPLTAKSAATLEREYRRAKHNTHVTRALLSEFRQEVEAVVEELSTYTVGAWRGPEAGIAHRQLAGFSQLLARHPATKDHAKSRTELILECTWLWLLMEHMHSLAQLGFPVDRPRFDGHLDGVDG